MSTGPMRVFRLEREAVGFVREVWHVLVAWSAGLAGLTSFFGVFGAWCRCGLRGMEVLELDRFG